MASRTSRTYASRNYTVTTGRQARDIASQWLIDHDLPELTLGMAEVDDRYHVWRMTLLAPNGSRAGGVAVDAKTGTVSARHSSKPSQLVALPAAPALATTASPLPARSVRNTNRVYDKHPTQHLSICGDAATELAKLPAQCVDLVFTSPPYYNARPEYAEYESFAAYMQAMREVLEHCHRVLNEGRFLVVNVSPVLIPRASRSQQSRRIPVPAHFTLMLEDLGFDYIDTIIWEKPEGAGWAVGRGRRFAADRQPLQYKPVTITEDILVFRKRTDRLLDWNLATYPNQDARQASHIQDGYERTNIWHIAPAHDKQHPAVFPEQLAEHVIRYYSIETDTVLDPFAGTGTVGRVATRINRGYVLIERDQQYLAKPCDVHSSAKQWQQATLPS